MQKLLGILGGMGPMASQLLYKKITEYTEAERDQDHINLLLLSHAEMPDRTEAILSGKTEEIIEKISADLFFLQAAGCCGLCIPCNTSHNFVPELQKRLNIPIINMVEESAAALALKYPGGKIGILATDGTINTGLYRKAFSACGLISCEPSPDVQKCVMHIIYNCVKAGKAADKKSLEIIDSFLKNEGCTAALLACTELSVVKENGDFPSPFYMDAMDVLALKAIEFMGKVTLHTL